MLTMVSYEMLSLQCYQSYIMFCCNHHYKHIFRTITTVISIYIYIYIYIYSDMHDLVQCNDMHDCVSTD